VLLLSIFLSLKCEFKVAGDCGSTRVWVGSAQVEKFPGTAAVMRMNRGFRLFYLSSYGNVLRKMEAPGSDMPFVQALALNLMRHAKTCKLRSLRKESDKARIISLSFFSSGRDLILLCSG
jgi:hypothetical protein